MTRYLYDQYGNLLIEKNNNEIDKIYLYGNGIEGYFVPDEENNAIFFSFVKNAHGDVVKVKCQTTVLAEYDYDAFGDTVKCEETDISNSVRYAGYQYDSEIDKYYLKNRYYNGATGRFMTEDPYWNVNNMLYGNATSSVIRNVYYPAVVQSGNRFGYCGNKPIVWCDPNGTDAIILTAEDSARGFGHTSALYQDKNGDWYYTYWGMDAAAVIRMPDLISEFDENGPIYTATMDSIGNFNHVLTKMVEDNDWSKIVTDYTHATYVFGDFTDALTDAFESTASVMENSSTDGVLVTTDGYMVFQGKNGDYNLFANNCLQVTYENFSKGYLDNNLEVSQYMVEFFLIPNISKNDFQNYFFNDSFTKNEAIAQLKYVYATANPNSIKRNHNVYYDYLETISTQE